MEPKQKELFNEAIRIELNIYKIYSLFSLLFNQDKEFWLQLSKEEMNHATLLRIGMEEYWDLDLFPKDLLYPYLERLKEFNYELEKYLDQYANHRPNRETAYKMALNLELANQEKQFNTFMEKIPPESKVMKLFQTLNGENKDHIQRIKNLIEKYETHSKTQPV